MREEKKRRVDNKHSIVERSDGMAEPNGFRALLSLPFPHFLLLLHPPHLHYLPSLSSPNSSSPSSSTLSLSLSPIFLMVIITCALSLVNFFISHCIGNSSGSGIFCVGSFEGIYIFFTLLSYK